MTTLTAQPTNAGGKDKKQKDKGSKSKDKLRANHDKQKKSKKDKKKKGDHLTAKTADRHVLYELSVQDPDAEVDLIEQVWKEQRSRDCESIREDFCGTAVVCGEWVKRRRVRTAIGVDLDGEVLGWGQQKLTKRLNEEQASRVTLRQENVLTVSTEKVDSVLAMNFSYYIFQTRDQMRDYFKAAYHAIKDDGLFLLDAYGGSESFSEIEEERELDGFTYVWEQHHYSPVTGRAVNYIHFRFPDGSEMEKAFEYTWRLWTLPEIQELLKEAGFSKVVVYWEGEDEETGEGNGEWSVTDVGEACPGWIAYLVAMK